MIVDDYKASRYAIARLLRQEGFEVREASTAAEARAAIAAGRPDLMIIDVKLPDFNGITLTGELRADPATRDVPIVQISATFWEEADRRLGLVGGADEYLTGFMPPELVATVKRLLAKRQNQGENTP